MEKLCEQKPISNYFLKKLLKKRQFFDIIIDRIMRRSNMDKVTISNLQGESGLVNVVRFFNNNGAEYLIYSLNEVDEAGYTRLYVTKLNGVDGMYTADTLNDNEWNEIKNLVKIIVKSNKEGMPTPVQDINPKKINNILLKDKKVFKLNAPLVNDLSANKPNFDTEDNDGSAQKTIQPTFEAPSAPTFETPVQPTFEVPSTPTFETQVQPTFEVPSTPTFETPVQPTFEVPSAPTFETPVQPTFEVPSAPTFETPVQPTFNVPSAPTFETPVQPTFDFNAAFNTPEQTDTNTITQTSTDNYKMMYEEEVNKNKELQAQLDQYKEIINNVKNLIEK